MFGVTRGTVRSFGEVMGSRVFCAKRVRVSGFNLARKPATCSEGAGHCGPDGTAGINDILEDSVHGIFVEDAKVAVGMDVHFESLQLETFFVRPVVQGDGAEIRQIRFGADRGVFGDLDRDLVAFVLIWERLDFRQWCGDAAFGVPFIVAKFRDLVFFSDRFTFHVSIPQLRLNLFHPISLTDFL